MNKNIILITNSFPYFKQAPEVVFLNNEFKFIKTNFENIHILPLGKNNKTYDNIGKAKISDCLIKKTSIINSLFSLLLNFNLLFILTSQLVKLKTIDSFKRTISSILNIVTIKKRLKSYLKSNGLEESTIIYTYWFTNATIAAVLLKKEINSIKVVTRVHGKDFYLERNKGFIPFRCYGVEKIDRVFCVSAAGLDYLSQKYEKFNNKFLLSRLGVKYSGTNIYMIKTDNVFRIVSCSSLIPLKRVDLILQGVIKFAQLNENINVEYVHFGDGIEMVKIKKIIETHGIIPNLEINFKGNVKNKEIIDYYRNNYVDVFINLSTTEGVPVSILEAQSFAIPFIGTNVGGIPEIINGRNGIIVNENPSVSDITKAFNSIYNLDNNEILKMRNESYYNWLIRFNSESNYSAFANTLVNM